MRAFITRKVTILSVMVVGALATAGNALAGPEEDLLDGVKDKFDTNLLLVVAFLVATSVVLWGIRFILRSVGLRKPGKL